MLKLRGFVIITFVLSISTAFAARGPLLRHLCANPDLFCTKVQPKESWNSLFPDSQLRRVVMQINRINIPLRPGMTIAIPKRMEDVDLNDFAPFDKKIKPGNKLLIFNPVSLAWVAYDENGNLLRWGAGSGGSDWCADLGRPCRTKVGVFRIHTMRGKACFSSIFPRPRGGAPMPYCMFFFGGQAFHGASAHGLPGFNASHGCIRLFVEDAQWLYTNFVTIGTTVIIKPYNGLLSSIKPDTYADEAED